MAILSHILQLTKQAEKDVQLDSTVVKALSRLLDVKPEYDWTPLKLVCEP